MTREELKDIFLLAKESHLDIYVEITIPNQKDTEYIINKYNSLDNKLNYYLNTYDENCTHKNNNEIKIIKAGCIDFYMGGE